MTGRNDIVQVHGEPRLPKERGPLNQASAAGEIRQNDPGTYPQRVLHEVAELEASLVLGQRGEDQAGRAGLAGSVRSSGGAKDARVTCTPPPRPSHARA